MSERSAAELLHFWRIEVTDTCVARSYGVCRGPGGPLGAVTVRFDGGTA